jgi:hypothetical protein
MRELVVRAHLHRSRPGDRSALATARLLAASIDNPDLRGLLDGQPVAGPASCPEACFSSEQMR